MISRTPAPSVEQIRAQGFQILIGEGAVLLGPDGRRYHSHHKCMVGCDWYPAGQIRNILAEDIESQLKADIESDKQARHRELKKHMADKDRRPARRPPLRRGKQRRDEGDPLGLVGKEFITPPVR